MHDVIALGAGFPPSSLFPFTSISINLHDGTSIQFDQSQVNSAQQYNSNLRGHPALFDWITRHVQSLHKPPSPHDIVITNGNNHALEILTSLFLDRGDPLLMEEFCYPVMPESIAVPKGYIPLAVPIDEYGIIPQKLRNILEQYYKIHAHSDHFRRPKLLYTIPTGQNPTGASTTQERKREIYQICRDYDIWILEDDPYYYLQWNDTAAMHAAQGPSGHHDLLAAVPGLTGLMQPALTESRTKNYSNQNATHTTVAASYLSIDVDQRVIRLDTFSKFLAPGLRLGWVTARNDVVEKLVSAIQAHTVGPSSLGQTVVAATLVSWGDAGLDAHLRRVQAEYVVRCHWLLQAMEKHLGGNGPASMSMTDRDDDDYDGMSGGVYERDHTTTSTTTTITAATAATMSCGTATALSTSTAFPTIKSSSSTKSVSNYSAISAAIQTPEHTNTLARTVPDIPIHSNQCVAKWTVPHAGMFLWVKLQGITDVHDDIWDELREAKVIVCPGKAMHCHGYDPRVKCPYVRISFSSVSHEAMDEGMRRLAAVLNHHHHHHQGSDVNDKTVLLWNNDGDDDIMAVQQ